MKAAFRTDNCPPHAYRYTIMAPSIYDTPYDKLPNPRQVWLGESSSHEEGLGKVSLLTPELVAKTAAEEIKTGKRVTMSWDLTKMEYAGLGRSKSQHHILPIMGGMAFDDIYMMNPRSSPIVSRTRIRTTS